LIECHRNYDRRAIPPSKISICNWYYILWGLNNIVSGVFHSGLLVNNSTPDNVVVPAIASNAISGIIISWFIFLLHQEL
ncbi:MAG: hypothetical protein ACFFA5_05240, partial [Promethearchaeota archaeon]